MPSDVIKIKARDELIRVTEDEIGQKFSSLSQNQQSISATKFYVREIHNPLRNNISEDDIIDSVVDGKNDLGCDFIYRDDGHVLIIQSKFRASGTNENSETLSHFHSILKRFRDLSSVANSYLREILSEIDWATDTFELVFLTFGKLDGQARTVSSQLPAYPKGVEDLEGRCEWKFLDEEEINVELRSARNLLRGLSSRFVTLYPIGEKGKRGASSVIEIESGG